MVFVEDPTLRLLAGHPHVRHVSMVSLATVAAADMEYLLLAMAERARSMAAEHAGRHSLDWSFAVVSEALSMSAFAMEENDFLVVEGTARPFAGHMRLHSRFASMAHAATLPVLTRCHIATMRKVTGQ